MKRNIVQNPTVSAASLRRAAEIMDSIEAMQNELTALMSGSTVAVAATAPKAKTDKRGKFTPAQRAKISAGLKAKWAERKLAKSAPVGEPATPESCAPTPLTPSTEPAIPAGAEACRMVAPPVRA